MDSVAEGVGVDTALLLALVSTLVLAVLHLLAPHIRRLPLVPERVTSSFAGGLAVAYVFLHLLPELAEGHGELRELFHEAEAPSPLVELGIFLVALAGFCLFFVLERLAARRRGAATGSAGAGPDVGVFWVHLGAFGLYNGVITYTLPLTYRTGVAFAVLFTIAMGLHFVLSDRGLEENYGALFDRWLPRLLLAGALGLGWVLAALLAPTSSVTVSVIVAFLAGSVLLNVFKQEIPAQGRTSLPWFLVGLVLYAALLALVTSLGAGGG